MRARTDVATVFKRIVASIPQQQRAKDKLVGKAWRWAEGVYVFPEAICPFCNGIMRSGCLWQIDEHAQKMVRIAGVVKDRLKELAISHPHIHSNKTLCMGARTKGVAQAIFMGMNQYDCMNPFDANRDGKAWVSFFATYFNDHVHTRRRRRPKLVA